MASDDGTNSHSPKNFQAGACKIPLIYLELHDPPCCSFRAQLVAHSFYGMLRFEFGLSDFVPIECSTRQRAARQCARIGLR